MELNSLAGVMNLLPEVEWDRCVVREVRGVVYGWVKRDDGRFDFVVLSWWPFGLQFTTSSAKHSKEFSERLFGPGDGHQDCQRVEDVFGDLVERKVVLAKGATDGA